jgi:GNAT superfamily N-acetyltransferase
MTRRARAVRRELAGGFELDDDVTRVDRSAVHDFITNHSYWAPGRSRAEQDTLIDRSARVVGLYHEGRQVGFTRTVSDGHIAYLADVYVLPVFRGRGLGTELVRESVDRGPYAGVRWLLHTADAHELYGRFGFAAASERVLERERRERFDAG